MHSLKDPHRGWEDGSVGKVLPTQARSLEFDSRIHVQKKKNKTKQNKKTKKNKKRTWQCVPVISVLTLETDSSLVLTDQVAQSSQQFQASERSCLMKARIKKHEAVLCKPVHTHACSPTRTGMDRYVHVHMYVHT